MENLKFLYDFCNSKFFNDELPKSIIPEYSSRLTSSAGICKKTIKKGNLKTKVKISTHYLKKYPDELMSILLHEMIHVKHPYDGHQRKFISEMYRINKLLESINSSTKLSVHSKENALNNYGFKCPNHGIIAYKPRKPRVSYLCNKCRSPVEVVEI